MYRGDIIFDDHVAIVLIKWSKTLQNPDHGSYKIIPKLGQSTLCPVSEIQNMIKCYPVQENEPMLVNSHGVITQTQLRTHLRRLLIHINVCILFMHLTGATLALTSGVVIVHIKEHGTWLSDAVHTYIVSDPQNASAAGI